MSDVVLNSYVCDGLVSTNDNWSAIMGSDPDYSGLDANGVVIPGQRDASVDYVTINETYEVGEETANEICKVLFEQLGEPNEPYCCQ